MINRRLSVDDADDLGHAVNIMHTVFLALGHEHGLDDQDLEYVRFTLNTAIGKVNRVIYPPAEREAQS